jgi:hypothetical protein
LKNGKQYGSKASAYQVLVREKRENWSQDGMRLLSTTPALTADFAYHAGEFKFHNPMTGSEDVGADIRGNFFDSAQFAIDNNWSQEDHDYVVQVLDELCNRDPEHIWHLEKAKLPAPWPTYDDTPHGKVVELAQTLGLTAEALQYEKENKARPSIIEGLTAAAPQEPEVVDELVAS